MAYLLHSKTRIRGNTSEHQELNQSHQAISHKHDDDFMEYSYEEYMCDRLTEYIEELHQFRSDISSLAQKLTINFPKIQRHRKTKSSCGQRLRIDPFKPYLHSPTKRNVKTPTGIYNQNKGLQNENSPKNNLFRVTTSQLSTKNRFKLRQPETTKNEKSLIKSTAENEMSYKNNRYWIIVDLPKYKERLRPKTQMGISSFECSPYNNGKKLPQNIFNNNNQSKKITRKTVYIEKSKDVYEISKQALQNVKQKIIKIRRKFNNNNNMNNMGNQRIIGHKIQLENKK